MGLGRIRAALQAIDTELKMCELPIIGWSKLSDSPLRYKKRQLKAKVLGIVKHDRILNWRA